MRALVIVLAVVALSFTALLVYGVARDRPVTAASGQGGCGGPPPVRDGADVDPDALDHWCPPDLAGAVSGIGRRFAPGVAIDRPEVTLAVDGVDGRDVPAATKDRPRAAKLTLVEGAAVAITARQTGRDDATICLCQAGTALLAAELARCRAGWKAKLTPPATCPADLDVDTLPFDPPAGTLRFQATRPARVRVG